MVYNPFPRGSRLWQLHMLATTSALCDRLRRLFREPPVINVFAQRSLHDACRGLRELS
jgi:hypothetical protein